MEAAAGGWVGSPGVLVGGDGERRRAVQGRARTRGRRSSWISESGWGRDGTGRARRGSGSGGLILVVD